jgi:hypothetical protein
MLQARYQGVLDACAKATPAQLHAVLVTIFEAVEVDDRWIVAITVKRGWEPYFEAAYEAAGAADRVMGSERKTGLEPAVGTHSHAPRPRRWTRPRASCGMSNEVTQDGTDFGIEAGARHGVGRSGYRAERTRHAGTDEDRPAPASRDER